MHKAETVGEPITDQGWVHMCEINNRLVHACVKEGRHAVEQERASGHAEESSWLAGSGSVVQQEDP